MTATTRHHVLLFGDQTDNVVGSIRDLYVSSKYSALLATFLRNASDICQIEFGNLQPCFRNETPPFESLLEMAENYAKTDRSPVFAACVVSYFARLGELILRAEHDETILSAPRVLVGLCINLFTAGIAATAKSATELARLSLEGFPSYFTWVVANHSRTKQIEWPHGIWSCMVSTDTDVNSLQTMLDRFHEEHNIINHKRTWIGVFGRGWVTVSGPPSTLQLLIAKLKSSDPSGDSLSFVPLPVASAVHAPHIPAFDFDSTVKPSYIWNLPLQEGACIMSTDECVPYTAKTLGEVTRQVIPAITSGPLMIDKLFTAVAQHLKQACNNVHVSVLGPSAQAASLIRTLRHEGIDVNVLTCPVYKPHMQMRAGSGAVAIVGMSARFPQANDLEQFWKMLMEGRTTHEKIPHDRFDLEGFYDPSGTKKNSMINTDGCFLSDPGAFDARLFNISPREAMQVDPTHRLLLMTSLEALEKAGYNSEAGLSSRNKRTAVYFGQNADVWRDFAAEQGVDVMTITDSKCCSIPLLESSEPFPQEELVTTLASRVDRTGMSTIVLEISNADKNSIDSACSSSATAIQLACAGLINRECDMALTGGAQIAGSPLEFSALGKSGFLAPSGGCKTFRADADGYCRGEAVGVLVLKRLEDALADNDKIEALITGWGRNYSAGASSMTHPHPGSQEKLIRQVLRQANAKPSDISCIELHGTGTFVGDLAEMTSITRVFSRYSERNPLTYIGSVKANVGHSESAAGVSSVIKAALLLKEGIIPPQAMINSETELHPGLDDLDTSSISINMEPVVLESDRGKILVNSFDAAGGNTCLIVEKAPKSDKINCKPDPRCHHLVAVSAQTSKSLRDNKINLLGYLVKHPETRLSDVAYSTTARRTHHSWRSEYTVKSTAQLIEQLSEDISLPRQIVTSATIKPKVVFLFNGQGTRYYRTARELYNAHTGFRNHLNTLQSMCEDFCGDMRRSIIDFLVDLEPTQESFVVEEHLAIVCIQLAMAELWKSWGVEPDIVLGHSIGEYAALSVAGVLSVADTLWLVSERAKLFEATYKCGEYGMICLSATADDIRTILRDRQLQCDIACFNAHESHVVGGPIANLRELEKYAASEGIQTKFLLMPHTVHSEPMQRIYGRIEAIATKVSFFKPQIPVSSTVTGEVITQDGVFNAQYIARHARQPVQFSNALKSIRGFLLQDRASPLWVQMGPGSAYLNLLRQTLDVTSSQLLPSLDQSDSNWKTITSSLGKAYVAGLSIDWPEFHKPFTQYLELLDLPTYAFDLKTFWRPYTAATASARGMSVGDRERNQHEFVPTATVQKIQYQKVSSERIEITFSSSLSDNRLRDAIRGHSIEGVCVCPASVYVDMAYTAAAYVHKIVLPKKEKKLCSLKYLELNTPFVLNEASGSQAIQVKVIAEKKDDWEANISFHSKTENGQTDDHGSCQVLSDNIEIKPESKGDISIDHARMRCARILGGNDTTIQAQIDRLRCHMFYKLYNTFVNYDSRYQGVVEAFIREIPEDDKCYEAVAEVKLIATPNEEKNDFTLNPYYSDSLVHIGGFAVNINLSDSDKDNIYFSSGIGSITLFSELSGNKNYQSYFLAHVATENTSKGNVYIFCGDQTVGVVKDLVFQKVRRNVLKALLLERQSSETPSTTVLSRTPRELSAEVTTPQPAARVNSMVDAFLSALVAETGVNEHDIEDNTELSKLGVDSLMGIAIIRRVKAETGQTLPVSILSELRTIRAVRARLDSLNGGTQNAKHSVTRVQGFNPKNGQFSSSAALSLQPAAQLNLLARFKSNVVFLHGNTNSPNRPLFFVAGSSGSASVYAQLPKLASSTPFWVLESPFLDCPSEMNRTPQEIAPLYIAAMKTIQPTGPYLVGGYSAGAVHAYEIARLLIDNKEDVDKLILVDMKAHCPGETWDGTPQMEDVELLRKILLGDSSVPSNTPHKMLTEQLENERLLGSLQCMYNWKPIPMNSNARPKNGTVMIWARWGIGQHSSRQYVEYGSYNNPMAAENRNCRAWFYATRHTFDANGWDILVGEIQTHVIDGNHCDMLQLPYAAEVSRLIDEAITSRREN
ncbi:hypothetical protein FHL15_003134 [Xylaria flabelliformis]|uniref:Uncharacterized protein n=1 Tax=Xylaria flabelliformis TaxID=2512241 RepID=A0A553I712_9PEZI|nr:hypothetical protein FHL15_003134 [Xylaria flabelliformis]